VVSEAPQAELGTGWVALPAPGSRESFWPSLRMQALPGGPMARDHCPRGGEAFWPRLILLAQIMRGLSL